MGGLGTPSASGSSSVSFPRWASCPHQSTNTAACHPFATPLALTECGRRGPRSPLDCVRYVVVPLATWTRREREGPRCTRSDARRDRDPRRGERPGGSIDPGRGCQFEPGGGSQRGRAGRPCTGRLRQSDLVEGPRTTSRSERSAWEGDHANRGLLGAVGPHLPVSVPAVRRHLRSLGCHPDAHLARDRRLGARHGLDPLHLLDRRRPRHSRPHLSAGGCDDAVHHGCRQLGAGRWCRGGRAYLRHVHHLGILEGPEHRLGRRDRYLEQLREAGGSDPGSRPLGV
jgi:hypothetical protein